MKVTRAPCRRKPDDGVDRVKIAERFGDMITADHKVLLEDQESRLHHKCVVVVQDLGAQHYASSCGRPRAQTQVNSHWLETQKPFRN